MAIELIGKIKPKNNGTFPLVEASDITVDNNDKRLSEVLISQHGTGIIVSGELISLEAYDTLVRSGRIDSNKLYFVYEDNSE